MSVPSAFSSTDSRRSRHQACGRSRQREQHRLHDDLARDPRVTATDRLADGEFFRPRRRANQQQVHQVDAADQEQADRPCLHDQQHRLDRRDVFGVQRRDDRAEAGVSHHRRRGRAGLGGGVVRVHRGLRRFGRDAGASLATICDELPQCRRVETRSSAVGGQRDDTAAPWTTETGNPRGRMPTTSRSTPSTRTRRPTIAGIRVEPLAPDAVGQDCHAAGLERRFLFDERASERRACTEGGEEVRRHAHHRLALGRTRLADERAAFAIERHAPRAPPSRPRRS